MSRRRAIPNMSLAEAYDHLRQDYEAARTGRFRKRLRGAAATGSGADYHYRSEADYLRMMEVARAIDRNDPVVGQALTRLADNVLQDGITLDPDTGDEGLDRELLARWREWSTDPRECDLAGEYNLHRMARFVFRSVIVDGDVVVLPTTDRDDPDAPDALELIEAHRVRTPTGAKKTDRGRDNLSLVHGVLVDRHRRRHEYWVTQRDVGVDLAVRLVSDMLRYPAWETDDDDETPSPFFGQTFPAVFHVHNAKRVSQTRGVTAFAPVFNPIAMHDDIQFAKLVQQQVVSCFAIIRQQEEAPPPATAFNPEGAQTTETLADGTVRTIEGISPGMDIRGRPGETITGFSPSVPNPEFFQHAMLVLSIIAVNLGMPVHVLLLDPSKTNFSGWRGAIDQARMGFRDMQAWMCERFYRPVYVWKLRQWAAVDPALTAWARRLGGRYFGHKWNKPRWPYIEPIKDATADTIRLKGVLASPRQLHAERGRDWNDVYRETVEDNAAAIRLARTTAQQINQDLQADNQPVHWRELLSLPLPEGLKLTFGAEPVTNDRDDE